MPPGCCSCSASIEGKMKIVQTGGKPVEYRAHAVAVYEPGSGRVLHVHHTLRLAGRPAPPAAGLEEEALAHAAGLGHAATGLRALVLEEVPAPGAYRVD